MTYSSEKIEVAGRVAWRRPRRHEYAHEDEGMARCGNVDFNSGPCYVAVQPAVGRKQSAISFQSEEGAPASVSLIADR